MGWCKNTLKRKGLICVDYYELAEDNLETVKVLINGKKYMQAVYYSCLAAEMYLKSRHSIAFSLSELDKTHDIIGFYRDLVSPPELFLRIDEFA